MDQILKTSGTQNRIVEKEDELVKVAEFLLNQLEMGLLFNEVN